MSALRPRGTPREFRYDAACPRPTLWRHGLPAVVRRRVTKRARRLLLPRASAEPGPDNRHRCPSGDRGPWIMASGTAHHATAAPRLPAIRFNWLRGAFLQWRAACAAHAARRLPWRLRRDGDRGWRALHILVLRSP